MPTGIALRSLSHEVSDEQRQKNLDAVVEAAGYELEKPEPEVPAEPKRDDFKTEEEFEAAQVAYEDKQKAAEPKEEEEVEEVAPASKKPTRKERWTARATADMQRKLDEANARIAALEAGGKKVEEPPKEAVRPKRDDFDTNEAYEDALLAWGVEKATKEKYSKDAEKAERSRQEELLTNYGAQVEEARESHEDWDELKAKFDEEDVDIGVSTQLAVLELENGAEVTYYLMRHPTYAAKLGKMSQIAAVMEVGRLSAKLNGGTGAPGTTGEADGGTEKKPRPKVPAPVKVVNTAGSSANPTFAEIAARPNYPGKAKDLRAALAARQ